MERQGFSLNRRKHRNLLWLEENLGVFSGRRKTRSLFWNEENLGVSLTEEKLGVFCEEKLGVFFGEDSEAFSDFSLTFFSQSKKIQKSVLNRRWPRGQVFFWLKEDPDVFLGSKEKQWSSFAERGPADILWVKKNTQLFNLTQRRPSCFLWFEKDLVLLYGSKQANLFSLVRRISTGLQKKAQKASLTWWKTKGSSLARRKPRGILWPKIN